MDRKGSRPKIPESIRRQVLVEAGHACAIWRCAVTSGVEVHHIIPWRESKEHNALDLIALCPNHHRMADAGEIDRQALRQYKLNLAAAAGFRHPAPEPNAPSMPDATTNAHWTRTVLERKVSVGHSSYDVVIDYPEFSTGTEDDVELNQIEVGHAIEALVEFRAAAFANQLRFNSDSWNDNDELGYRSSFEVAYLDEHFVSIKHCAHHFVAGAAHGSSVYRVSNYALKPARKIELRELFEDDAKAARVLSERCRASLMLQNSDADKEWVVQGTEPNFENFSVWNVTPASLVIEFPPYQVDCYAAGPQLVDIPWRELRALLARESPLARCGLRL